jgi:hypothetical protein
MPSCSSSARHTIPVTSLYSDSPWSRQKMMTLLLRERRGLSRAPALEAFISTLDSPPAPHNGVGNERNEVQCSSFLSQDSFVASDSSPAILDGTISSHQPLMPPQWSGSGANTQLRPLTRGLFHNVLTGW